MPTTKKKPLRRKATKKPVVVAAPYAVPKGSVLILRTCDKNRRSHNNFQWPESGLVAAPDWQPTSACGNGLHGLLWGEGDGTLLKWESDAVWQVVEAEEQTLVDLKGKVKFPGGVVVHSGTRLTATDFLVSHLCKAAKVVGCSLKGGYRSTLTGGYRSTLTGGYRSTLTGGDGSTLTGGDGSTLTGGYRSTLTGGYGSTLTGGDRSTLTGGDGSTLTGGYGSTLTGGDGSTLTGGYGSTLTGGDRSTLTGGYRSTLTGGYGSTLTGGDRSTLTGGDGSTLTGGDGSTLCFQFWGGTYRRVVTIYVGENGIEPKKKYRLTEKCVPELVG